MFGKNPDQSSGLYVNEVPGGTAYLRSTIRSTVYSGDPVLENKLVQAQLHWKYYNNRHWAKNNDKLLSFNYCRAIVDKVNTFMCGGQEGFGLAVTDDYGDEVPKEFETVAEALITYNWKKNNKQVLIQKILQMGAVTGDAYIFLSPNITKGFIEYTLVDSRSTLPMFRNGNYNDHIGWKVFKVLAPNDKGYLSKITEYTKGMMRTYYVKETGDLAQKYEVEEKPNDFDFIPVIHIENIPMSEGFGGRSDLEDIVKLNKVFNEMAEDVKMIIDYYAQPTTVITGGTVGQLKRGIGEIWSGLPEGANVSNLSLNEDLGASNGYLDRLKNAIHDMSGVPEEVLSKVPHISNTSAAAIRMLFQPIIHVCDRKAVSYGAGLENLHMMTFIMFNKYLPTHPLYVKVKSQKDVVDSSVTIDAFFDRFKVAPQFRYNLPNDRMGDLNEAQIELQNKIASRNEIMQRLGKRNIPLLEDQIKADVKADTDNQIDVQTAIVKAKETPIAAPPPAA